MSLDDALASHFDRFINFREAIDLLAWSEHKSTSDVARVLKELGVHKFCVYTCPENGGYVKDESGLVLSLLNNEMDGNENSFVFDGAADFFADEHACGWMRSELASLLNEMGVACPKEIYSSPSDSSTQRGLTRRERNIVAIESAIKERGYEKLAIPTGGKTNIFQSCSLTKSEFDGAWKDAVRQGRIRMADHEKFRRR